MGAAIDLNLPSFPDQFDQKLFKLTFKRKTNSGVL